MLKTLQTKRERERERKRCLFEREWWLTLTAVIRHRSDSTGGGSTGKRDAAGTPASDAKRARPEAQKGPHAAEHAPPREGERVAARDARNDCFMLARVVQYLPTKLKYLVEDADPTLAPGAARRSFQVHLLFSPFSFSVCFEFLFELFLLSFV